jgi:CDP-glycerol glycerophosphotransferase (TagB/SpsB family)
MQAEPPIVHHYTASVEPTRLAEIYHEAQDVRLVHPRRAAVTRFDAYIASDFMWAPLLRETARVQIFHGVGGKYGFDAPDRSMREWHRLFFVNERRLRNFIARGAIDADSPAIRLVGMPKVDCLVDGTFQREHVLRALGLDPLRPTVLYAPTWSPASSLNAIGAELLEALGRMPINVIMKLHDRSRDLRERYSGGVDWAARLQPLLTPGQGALAPGHDISPYLVAADLMITDHSSAGFEFLLRDKPLVRIHRPQLIELANVHPDYVSLLASVSRSVEDLAQTLAAVERGLADPAEQSGERRRVAADLFYKPGGATARSVHELYRLMELEPAPAVAADEERWRQSA